MLAWASAQSPAGARLCCWLFSETALPGGLTDYDLFVDASFNLAWLAVPVVLAT